MKSKKNYWHLGPNGNNRSNYDGRFAEVVAEAQTAPKFRWLIGKAVNTHLWRKMYKILICRKYMTVFEKACKENRSRTSFTKVPEAATPEKAD